MSGDTETGSDSSAGEGADTTDVLLTLPRELRAELKDPLGPIHTDTAELLADAGDPIVTVGDVVTYHLLQANHTPDVALVDGLTKREAVDDEVWAAIDGFDHRVEVENPAATLSLSLLVELRAALDRADDDSETTVVVVDGEEDLAALPAVLAAPDGASVVYGQPDRGMVLAGTSPDERAVVRDLLERMDGDTDRAFEALCVD